MRANAIPAIFSESTVSPNPAEQVARETGAAYGGVLYVDSLSDADGPVPTYLDLLRVTSETIAKGARAMNAAARSGPQPPIAAPGLSAQGVTVTYRNGHTALRDASFCHPARHHHRAGRRQRQRQVDAVQGHHGLRAAGGRRRSRIWASRQATR